MDTRKISGQAAPGRAGGQPTGTSGRGLGARPGRGIGGRRGRAPLAIALAGVVLVVLVGVFALASRAPAASSSPPPSGLGAASPISAVSASPGTGSSGASPAGSGSGGAFASLHPPGGDDLGYLTSLNELAATVARAKAGQEPAACAVRALLDWAATAVAEKAHPSNPLLIAGTTGPFVDDTARAYGLALAWAVSGKEAYAEAASAIVNAWVSETRSLADACPTGGECQTSLVVGRAAPGFVFAVDLIAGSPAWTHENDTAFRAWLRDVILPAASLRDNNWGDAGLLLRATAARFLGDAAGFEAAMADWRRRIDLIEPDGSIPEETRRGDAGIQYTQEALLYKVAVARIAERQGIDLWSTKGAKGGSLKAALGLLADYWQHPEDWPFDPHASLPDPAPLWEIAYAHWQEPAYARILLTDRPNGPDGHSSVRWTTLTSGILAKP